MTTKPYEKQTCEELRSLLRDRKLIISGNKGDLIQRLYDSDNGISIKRSSNNKKSIKKQIPKKPYGYLSHLIFPSLDRSLDYFSIIPLDIILQISMFMSSLDIYVLAMSSPSLMIKILQNEEFWKRYHRLLGQQKVPKDIVTYYHKIIAQNIYFYQRRSFYKATLLSASCGLIGDIHLIFELTKRSPEDNMYENGLRIACGSDQFSIVEIFIKRGTGKFLSTFVQNLLNDQNIKMLRYIMDNYGYKLDKYALGQGTRFLSSHAINNE